MKMWCQRCGAKDVVPNVWHQRRESHSPAQLTSLSLSLSFSLLLSPSLSLSLLPKLRTGVKPCVSSLARPCAFGRIFPLSPAMPRENAARVFEFTIECEHTTGTQRIEAFLTNFATQWVFQAEEKTDECNACYYGRFHVKGEKTRMKPIKTAFRAVFEKVCISKSKRKPTNMFDYTLEGAALCAGPWFDSTAPSMQPAPKRAEHSHPQTAALSSAAVPAALCDAARPSCTVCNVRLATLECLSCKQLLCTTDAEAHVRGHSELSHANADGAPAGDAAQPEMDAQGLTAESGARVERDTHGYVVGMEVEAPAQDEQASDSKENCEGGVSEGRWGAAHTLTHIRTHTHTHTHTLTLIHTRTHNTRSSASPRAHLYIRRRSWSMCAPSTQPETATRSAVPRWRRSSIMGAENRQARARGHPRRKKSPWRAAMQAHIGGNVHNTSTSPKLRRRRARKMARK
jgi:hypothetical protein